MSTTGLSKMDKQAFIDHMLSVGWLYDKFGHLQQTVSRRVPHADYPVGKEPFVTRNYRVKLQNKSCRIEIQVWHERYSRNEWVRLGGAYYTQISECNITDHLGRKKVKVRVGSFLY